MYYNICIKLCNKENLFDFYISLNYLSLQDNFVPLSLTKQIHSFTDLKIKYYVISQNIEVHNTMYIS